MDLFVQEADLLLEQAALFLGQSSYDSEKRMKKFSLQLLSLSLSFVLFDDTWLQ